MMVKTMCAGGHIRRLELMRIYYAKKNTMFRQGRRAFAVYAVGEGWTGALGHGYTQEVIPGHFDDDDNTYGNDIVPIILDPEPFSIDQASVGWGHTAILKDDGKLWMVGRPHDFVSLLRLYRFPSSFRSWAVASTTKSSSPSPEAKTFVGSMISSVIGWATGQTDKDDGHWETARQYSYLSSLTSIEVANEKSIKKVVCGAGVSAVLGASGTLYTFGINNRGQCGAGTVSNNVWTPQPVKGLSTVESTDDERKNLEQEEPIQDVALGLQHGLALSESGYVYSWGKASRGQLGRDVASDQDTAARPLTIPGQRVVQISSGMHHGALLTSDNEVFVWGKNMGLKQDNDDGEGKMSDAKIPRKVEGLPTDRLQVLQISCGSHHTSVLMEDGSVYALGIAADVAVFQDTAQLIPPGVIDIPCRHFEAHQDRTTIVGRDGRQVIQVHLWKDKKLREFSMFAPSWVDYLLDDQQSVRAVHRGWLHTIVVTQPDK